MEQDPNHQLTRRRALRIQASMKKCLSNYPLGIVYHVQFIFFRLGIALVSETGVVLKLQVLTSHRKSPEFKSVLSLLQVLAKHHLCLALIGGSPGRKSFHLDSQERCLLTLLPLLTGTLGKSETPISEGSRLATP